MGTKNPRSLATSGFFGVNLFWMHNMVAGVGFFIALPSRIVVFSRLCLLGSENSLLCGVSLRKKDTQSFLLAHPRPPPSVVEQFKIRSTDQKDKAVHLDCFIFLCCTANLDATLKKSIKSRVFGFLKQFHVHPK